MPIYALSVDIGPGDHRAVRSLAIRLRDEVRRGRRPNQVSVNGSLSILQTPETASALIARIVGAGILDPAHDRLSVIDLAARKITNWGRHDPAMRETFPLLVTDSHCG
ncbi:hypothetical protein [Methylobacterium sp. WL120]|uniref:hypothetical protein n=1 Tax=Methylobacterium sp. WL120 TaxID=2603887 RepID=UPI0011C75DD4|nr:hypothetical protein [Methylobacterium sp. WL120]TXM64658.1 hypothetical protein FV229_17895 [Methylobacterium sp. WL120]